MAQGLKQWSRWNRQRLSRIMPIITEKLANALQKLWRGGRARNVLRHAWCGRSQEFTHEVVIDHEIAYFTRPARLSISKHKFRLPKTLKIKFAGDAMLWEKIYRRNVAASWREIYRKNVAMPTTQSPRQGLVLSGQL